MATSLLMEPRRWVYLAWYLLSMAALVATFESLRAASPYYETCTIQSGVLTLLYWFMAQELYHDWTRAMLDWRLEVPAEKKLIRGNALLIPAAWVLKLTASFILPQYIIAVGCIIVLLPTITVWRRRRHHIVAATTI